MAVCPKCSRHIKVWQMSPYCKGCGAHLMFASFEQQFEKDRREAEMSMAFFRYTLAKIKSAYISGRPQKFKIIAALFPVIALFLPLGNLTISTPVYSSSLTFNVIDMFIGPFFTNGLFGKLDALCAAPVFGEIASALKPLMLIYAVMAASAAVILLAELLSFTGNKKVCITTIVFSVTGIIAAVLTKLFSAPVADACAGVGTMAEASSSFLFIIAAALFVIPLVAAVWCLRCPPVCTFKEGDELRVEYRKKYKKGQIELLNIPSPIYESEEDKREKKKLISQAYNMSEEVTVSE